LEAATEAERLLHLKQEAGSGFVNAVELKSTKPLRKEEIWRLWFIGGRYLAADHKQLTRLRRINIKLFS
jgi:hypothetical protein